jgi:hypothetical protein
MRLQLSQVIVPHLFQFLSSVLFCIVADPHNLAAT